MQGLGPSIGLALPWAGGRALFAAFFTLAAVKAGDPVLLVGAPLMWAGLALVASNIPVLRSTRIDPAVTLLME